MAAFNNDGMSVKATYYNPNENQTDSTPYLTASGIVINPSKLRQGQLRYVSVSRDIRAKYGISSRYKKVYINVKCSNPHYNGRWQVVDTMSKRFRGRVDFLQAKRNSNKPPLNVTIYGQVSNSGRD
jgi:hypothetical protein